MLKYSARDTSKSRKELLSLFSPFRYFVIFFTILKAMAAIEIHICICQVSPQL